MKKVFKKSLSLFLVLCSLLSVSFISAKAATVDSVLAKTSLYFLKDNFVYDVSVDTSLSTFVSNLTSNVTVYTSAGKKAASSDIISTGCYFNSNGKKYTVIVSGDVDGSGIIDSTDYLRVKGHFISTITLSDGEFKAADIDNSKSIDTTDYLKIKSSFMGTYFLQSSSEYIAKKSLVSNILSATELLMNLSELDASFKLSTTSATETANISGTLLANNIKAQTPNFSFKVNANSSGVSLPISESHYNNGTLYSVNDGKKYKVKASYADVSKYLSSYVAVSPVDSEGRFVIVPQVNREKFLGENYVSISSNLKTLNLGVENGFLKYSFETDNILDENVFYNMFIQSTIASSFNGLNIKEVFESIFVNGNVFVNVSGVFAKAKLNLELNVKDSAIIKLGAGTPKQINAVFEIEFKNIGGSVTITPPTASQYVTIDNIFTQYAFTAYDKVYDIASAVSSQYKETITLDNSSVSLDMKTNVKNVKDGIELSRKKVISGAASATEDLYIGNSKYIVSTDGKKVVTDLNTSSLSVDKSTLFATPHYETVGDISTLKSFNLTENSDSYVLNYTLSLENALSLLKNSAAYSYMESKLGVYSDEEYSIKSTSGKLTYSKDTFEVISHTVNVSFKLTAGNIVSYSFTFDVKSTDPSSVSVDKTLAQ